MYLDSPFPQSPLMSDMEVPLMMQCDQLYTRFSSAHMLFSNGSSSSPLHYDGYENFLTSMSGNNSLIFIYLFSSQDWGQPVNAKARLHNANSILLKDAVWLSLIEKVLLLLIWVIFGQCLSTLGLLGAFLEKINIRFFDFRFSLFVLNKLPRNLIAKEK